MKKKKKPLTKSIFIFYSYRHTIPISMVNAIENLVLFVNTYEGSFPSYGSQEQHSYGQGVWTTRLSSTTYYVLPFHQWSFSILYTIWEMETCVDYSPNFESSHNLVWFFQGEEKSRYLEKVTGLLYFCGKNFRKAL